MSRDNFEGYNEDLLVYGYFYTKRDNWQLKAIKPIILVWHYNPEYPNQEIEIMRKKSGKIIKCIPPSMFIEENKIDLFSVCYNQRQNLFNMNESNAFRLCRKSSDGDKEQCSQWASLVLIWDTLRMVPLYFLD